MNDKVNNDWIDAVRRKVTMRETPVADDNWDAVKAALDKRQIEEAITKADAGRRFWLTWAAVAASLAVLLTVGSYLMFRAPHDAMLMTAETQERATAQNDGARQNGEREPLQPLAVVPMTVRQDAVQKPAAVAVDQERANPETVVGHTTAQVVEAEKNDSMGSNQKAAVTHKVERTAERKHRLIGDELAYNVQASSKRGSRGGGAVNVYGSGFPSGNNPARQDFVMMNAPFIMTNMPMLEPDNTSEYEYKHKQPVTVGVTFSKQVGYGISVTAGLAYTLLRSDVNNTLTGKGFEQRLQFVGIPIGANWTFVKYNRFEAYAGAEMEMERCVDARFGDEKITIKQLQWSAHALVGGRVRLANHLSFYIEPKASHYFNELPLTTIRNEHPVNFNLQLGLSLDY